MAVIGSLSVKLGLVTVQWDQATAKAKAQAKDLQGAFNNLTNGTKALGNVIQNLGGALGLSAIGMGAMVQQTLAFANEVKDLSDGFGISIAKTLQFRDAIQTSGGEAGQATRMLATMFAKIQDARNGNEQAIAQFEQLGVSFKELTSLSNEQAITRVFNAVANGSENSYIKVKMLKEMLGKGGMGLSIQEVADKLNMSVGAYKKYEDSIKRAAEVSDNLKTTMDNLKIAFADMLSPFAKGGLVSIEQFKALLIGIGSAMLVGNLFKLIGVLKEIPPILKAIALGEASIQAAGGAKGIASLTAGIAAYEIAKMTFENDAENAGNVNDAELTPEAKAALQEQAAANRREIFAAQSKIALAKELGIIERERIANKIVDLDTDRFSGMIVEAELNRRKEIATIENQRVQALNKENLSEAQIANINAEAAQKKADARQKEKDDIVFINAQREKELKTIAQKASYEQKVWALETEDFYLQEKKFEMTAYEIKKAEETIASKKRILGLEEQIAQAKLQYGAGASFEAEKQRIKTLIDYEVNLSDHRQQLFDLEEYRRRSFSEGWGEAFRKYKEEAQNMSKLGAEAFQSMTSHMESALDNFVETGKISFSDLASSIIKDLIKIQLKAQMTSIFGSIFEGAGGFLSGLFGGGKSGGSSNVSSGISLAGFKLPFMASGGEIGGPAIVGENGPELFVPKTSGTIIPNNGMANAMGSQPQVVYNGPYIANMSAIDTQSATQFLAKNKTAVWSANQSAQRSLPQSR
jgi:lambda family phage tail tape measure protein